MPTKAEIEKFQKVETIIFDMDGVVTSEQEYWNAADLTVLELLYGEQFFGMHDTTLLTLLHKPGVCVELNRFVSPEFIALLKNNSINTNWDLAFFSAGLYAIDIMAGVTDREALKYALDEHLDEDSLRAIRELYPDRGRRMENIDTVAAYFMNFREKRAEQRDKGDAPTPEERALLFEEDFNAWRKERTGLDKPVFTRDDPFWRLCRDLFQEWYLGDSILEEQQHPKVGRIPKDGMIWYENPIIQHSKIISCLAMLKEAGLNFGIATGRPYREIMVPLHKWGLLHFFESTKLCTHREIAEAEKYLEEKGTPKNLAKPNPYIYLRAMFPEEDMDALLNMELPLDPAVGEKIIIVGDSLSDLLAAKTIGCLSAVVMTGVMDLETARLMKSYNPDFILDDISLFEDLF